MTKTAFAGTADPFGSMFLQVTVGAAKGAKSSNYLVSLVSSFYLGSTRIHKESKVNTFDMGP